MFLLAVAVPATGTGPAMTMDQPPGGYVLYVAPHSHIDTVWYWTYDQTEVMAIRILDSALQLLRQDPRYTFTQDQVTALKPFWDNCSPADKAFLREMVKAGRLELTTGMYDQPDIAEPDFESLTRQLLLGTPWMDQTFGAKIQTEWNIDTYGQTVQMPQLYKRAGQKYFVFMRDVPKSLLGVVKSPFYWEGPDHTRILSYWLAGTYALDGSGAGWDAAHWDTGRMAVTMRRYIDHNSPGNDKVFLPFGSDVYVPRESTSQIEALLRQAAAQAGIPVRSVIFCTPSQYFHDVEQSGVQLPTYTYDFNPARYTQDLRGQYAERPHAKLANRRSEDMLESAEKFSSLAAVLGLEYPAVEFRDGWEKVLFNQDHGALPGDNTDPVYDAMMSRYAGAMEAGRAALEQSLYYLSRSVDTRDGGNYPLLIFNPLSFARSEVVNQTVMFRGEVTNFRLADEAGRDVPFRSVYVARGEHTVTMAAIEFRAANIPSLGYSLYRVLPTSGKAGVSSWHPAGNEISNRFFAVRLDPQRGGLTSIVDRQTGNELLDTSRYQGNELVIEEEKNPDLEGMVYLTGGEIRMSQYPPESITEVDDELGTQIKIEGPYLSGRRTQLITLYHDLPRIDFETKLFGFPGHDGMLAVAFPLRSGAGTKLYYETHNAVVERPDEFYDAQTFVDAEGGGEGVAIINQGTGGYITEKGILKLVLLRSVLNHLRYYAPEAAEAGSHDFSYSLYAHPGDWRNGVIEQAHSFNCPFRVLATDAHYGSLPPHHAFFHLLSGNFEVTALKQADGSRDLILRGHETRGEPGRVALKLEIPAKHAWMADLLERSHQPVAIREGTVEFAVQPFEFVTLRLRPNE
jgi:alpha-mannosidase